MPLVESDMRAFVAGAYAGIVRAVALICDSTASAEDAVHEAMARAWVRRAEIDHLDRWVLTVALNVAGSRWRRLGRESPMGELDRSALEAATPDVDLHAAVRRLPARQREVIVMHYLLDLPVARIAAITGLSDGGVKHALFRGRHSLAAALQPSLEVEELSHDPR